MRVYTIGYAGKSAKTFFNQLKDAGVARLIDIRRSNNTLYSGFTRSRDLPFFLSRLCDIEYVEEPEFAPSIELLRQYQARMKKNKKDAAAWPEYAQRFSVEIEARPIVELFRKHAAGTANVCLLCAEAKPECCHRSVLAEHLKTKLRGEIEIVHL
jgi:uncharacterized protein (DUF488 family)